MKVVILEAFTGYPEQEIGKGKDAKGKEIDIVVNDGPAVAYAPNKGDVPVDVPDAFGKMIIAKGHARAAAEPVASDSKRKGDA